MTDDAMAELGRTREELRAALRKGVKGTRAEDRIEHLVDQHQAAVKDVLAHQLAEQQRNHWTPRPPGKTADYVRGLDDGFDLAADLIDPQTQRPEPADG
jgi:hypothetical protein